MCSRFLTAVSAILVFIAFATSSHAQDVTERRIIVSEDAAYAGFDYRSVDQTTLGACKKVCLADAGCRAFTFDTASETCTLKSDFGELATAKDSIAGRLVTVDQPDAGEAEAPALTFLSRSFLDEADRLKRRLRELDVDPAKGAHELWSSGNVALTDKDPRRAAQAFRGALKREPDVHTLWLDLAYAVLSIKGKDYSETARLLEEATSASINAYRISGSSGERARALSFLANALQRRQLFRASLEAYKASLLLKETASVRAAYQKLHDQHGFRMVDYSVDSDAASPRLCLQFSEQLRKRNTDFSSFVTVDDKTPAAVEARGQQLCIDGLEHGNRYKVAIRSGIPSKIGETLERSSTISVYVRDRNPLVRFTGRNYVLPRHEGHGIPLVTVNTETVKIRLLRIGDRALTDVIGNNRLFDQLSTYRADDIANMDGEEVWTGELAVKRVLNKEVTTRFPIDEALPTRAPGVYVMVAEPVGDKSKRWASRSTQWFIVSDLGLSSMSAGDGLHVFARSLSTAEALNDAEIELIARNNEVLGTVRTDANGHAVFPAGLIRGKGGLSPSLITARLGKLDYAFLDVSRPAFDFSDRGVRGRAAPGPLDAFLYTERGVYRPGATVHVAALLRDRDAKAVRDVPLTFIFSRPDGVEHRRMLSRDAGLGGHAVDLVLQEGDMQGSWEVAAYADPKAAPIAEAHFLVEEFVPDRIEFDLEGKMTALPTSAPLEAQVEGRFLYGAPASGLRLEGNMVVRPTSTLEGLDGYTFGLHDEEVLPVRTWLQNLPATDDTGKATLHVESAELPRSTRPFTALLTVSMRESGGRAVERSLSLAVERTATLIGVKPNFKNGRIGEGELASFAVLAVGPDGKPVDLAGVRWELLKVERNFQWYQVDGRWNYQSVAYTTRVADGRFDLTADGPASIANKIDWGRYRLEVMSEDPDGPATSLEFNAGWYVESAAADTPDMLELSFDKEKYATGETAKLNITSRFAGTALIAVVNDRLIDTRTVTVSEGSTLVDLAVQEDWGAGAHVTVTAFRPSDTGSARMPGRAIGLQWVGIDMSQRTTTVELDVPDIVRPRQPLDVLVKLPGHKAGKRARLTVAAVDVGILNLTGYKPPRPENWYYGQRVLGTEFRDLYGHLINGMQGVVGRIRSGAGDVPAGTTGSPPTQKPVSLFSGIVETDEDGRATVSFDVPEFNGTLRLMAVAWTDEGVGSGTRDVTVRDPIVVTASLPRFLAPDDVSRIRLDIDNTEGPAGDYTLSIADDPYLDLPGTDRIVTLEKGKRTAVDIPVTALEPGAARVSFTLSHVDGLKVTQNHGLTVRPAREPVSRRHVVTLASGATLTLDANRLTGLTKGTGSISLAITRAGAIDVPSLLHALDRYPYGCAEQTTSRALPLLYLSELATGSGLGDEAEIRERIQKAIYHVLAKQSGNGGFGVWGPGSGDIWLNAYVSDFLTRARELEYEVPDRALTQALDNLQNAIAVTPDPKAKGAGIAYGLYVLARNKRASLGDLRYYADTRLEDFPTVMSKAQLGAALALYGESERARAAFGSATRELLHTASSRTRPRADYGSELRDAAATLALAAETTPEPAPIASLVELVSQLRADQTYTSTQEKAWMLLAARALIADTSSLDLSVEDREHAGNLFVNLTEERLSSGDYTVTNRSEAPLQAVMTVTGVPEGELEPEGDGFAIKRTFYTLQGKPVSVEQVGQNERFVVVLEVTEHENWPAQLLVADLLPAGFEIDNPRLIGSADLKSYPWLQPSDGAAHLEFRDDRFVAALNRGQGHGRTFTLAYTVRAVTPGKYVLPAATVEDMYRPHLNAHTGMSRIEVIGPKP